MTYDIHNQERKIKGSFTHDFQHNSGAEFEMKHEEGAVNVVVDIVKEMEVDLIIELGTYQGGFTKLLEDAMPEVEIHTFDHEDLTMDLRPYFGENVHFYWEDVLMNTRIVGDLLTSGRKQLLYCDNGNKRMEVTIYSQFLKQGDYIAVHDWGTEVTWEDVEPFLGQWERYKWCEVEEVGQTSRFWRKPWLNYR